MAEYNPSKIIKDGNTYNFRDTTKIPLAGSNEISGNLVPSTDGTVNLGSSNYQWNNAYIKSLTINGVACGDILTHNASEFVGVTSNQIIGGTKTFSNGLFASKNTAGDLAILEDLSINSTNEDANGMPLTNHANSLRIKGSQAGVLPLMIVAQVATSGDTSTEFRVYKYKDLNKRAGINIYYTYANDKARSYFSNFDFILPGTTNITNLGSASLQWNNTYTRNILIDNDINISSSLINKTSTSGVISIRGGLNTQDGASIGLYGKDYNGAIAGNIYMTAYGNSDYTTLRIYPNGTMTAYNNSTNTTKNLAMQEDTVNLTTAQTISGTKTFSDLRTYFGRDISCYSRSKYGKNLNPTGTSYQYLNFSGNTVSDGIANEWNGGCLEHVVNTNGSSRGRWFIRDTSENGTALELWVSGTDRQVRPLQNGDTDLGSSTRKWKSFNGINPGALSLPSVSAVNIDTTDWDVTLSNNILGSFTPTFDGWVLIQLNPINADTDIWIIGGTMRTNYKTTVNLLNNTKFIMCYFPVLKGSTYNIYGHNSMPLSSVSIARLYPCQGNV